MKTALLLFSLFAIFSCATNPYRPFRDDVGYSELRESKDEYQVMFSGTDDQDELGARQYARARAADIAKREGYAYFKVDSVRVRDKMVQKSYVTSDPYCYDGPYGWYPGPYYGYGGMGYYGGACDNTVVTETETHPEVKLTFSLENAPCENCISVDEKLEQADAAGILNKEKAGRTDRG